MGYHSYAVVARAWSAGGPICSRSKLEAIHWQPQRQLLHGHGAGPSGCLVSRQTSAVVLRGHAAVLDERPGKLDGRVEYSL